MGRFTYWMNTSVDLFIEREAGEAGGGDWMSIDEALHRDFNERASRLAVFVQGRVVFETMEQFWPAAATDESQPQVMREYGRIWTDAPKVLVSNTRTEADFTTRVIGGDSAIDELAKLRAETDGEIGVGGANLATQLLHAGLLDELTLYVHPVVLGAGRPLFDGLTEPLGLDLLEQHAFDNGVVLHRYAIS